MLGGGGWTPRASVDMRAFVEANELPAGAAFRRQDAIDNDSPSYAGDVGVGVNPALAERVRDADLLLVVGPRLGEMTTSGYTLLRPRPQQTLVHVHPGAEELGRVYQAELPILSGMEQFAAAVRELRVEPRWGEWTAAARADYEAWQQPDADARRASTWASASRTCASAFPDAIVTNGAGNYTVWVHRFWRFHDFRASSRRPAARWATACRRPSPPRWCAPERTVVCFSGDGDFLMTGQELATAVQYDLPIVILVVNNGMYGTIRMHQERHFPGASSAPTSSIPTSPPTRGPSARTARRSSDRRVPAALERSLAAGMPAVITLRIDPDAITPRTTLSAIRRAQARSACRAR